MTSEAGAASPVEPAPTPGPISASERITSLDAARGVAILGILPMNALVFGLDQAGYLNVSADGIRQPVDWVVGLLTALLIEQKMMALFSLLFGVGVVVFADRALAKGHRAIGLSLWRFALLFVIGLVHSTMWEGDVLMLYAICAPVVLLVQHLPIPLLLGGGVVLALAGSIAAPFVQSTVGADGEELGELWLADGGDPSNAVLAWFLGDAAGRALGLMLIGVALFRLGIVQGRRDDAYYRRLAWWGVGTGGVVTAAGLAFRLVDDWSPEHAITGHVPTGLGTVPMALGYLALIILWNRRGGELVERFRNLGRMALTNYLTQTVLGVAMLTWWLSGAVELSRTMIAVWILGVWAAQLWWSTWWLDRYRYGPAEWAWRSATYRRQPPLRLSGRVPRPARRA